MNRTPQKWQDFDPTRAVNRLSRPALRIALEDARADVLELVEAFAAAKAFIDSHVGDPGMTEKMRETYQRYQEVLGRLGE